MSARAKIDWIAERERYVAGDESFTEVAGRLKISKTAVEKQSRLGGGWAKLRRAFREAGAEKAAKIATKSYAQKLRDNSETAADVAALALAKLKKRVESEDIKDSDLIAAAKLAMSTRLEVSGPEGGPISIEVDDIRKLTDEELQTLAAAGE